MKKCSFCLALALLICMMISPAQATSSVFQETEVIHTEYGTFEIETTTVVYDSLTRSNSKSADRVRSVKYGGKVIAEIMLFVTFGYDGKTAWVTDASSSHSTYDGWSYNNENISKSGNTATLTATLTHLFLKDILVNISLTCSPTGQIS